ncbi:RNA polymerase sigma factor [Pedobacter sp. WC2423]|uniref:RNA polymerase sigma factor n=1 Tax=Pedobacter sp. WC2423 TaxID=3234142 RepID=UPI0034671D90
MESEKTVYSYFSDAMLLEHLKKSDRLAFIEIFERYWKKVYNESYKRIKNHTLAESITECVFINLWEERENAKTDKLLPYLLASLRFCILQLYIEGKADGHFENGLSYRMLSSTPTGIN